MRDHFSGAAVSGSFNLPDVAVNDDEQQAFDVVNTGSAAVSVQSAAAIGLYYSLCCQSAFVLQPGASLTLTLQFAPTQTGNFSGSLQIDSLVILLFGRSVPAASLYITTSTGLAQAHSGTPLTVLEDASFNGQLAAVLENNSTTPVNLTGLSAAGEWTISGAPSLPGVLAPGAQAAFVLQRSSPSEGTNVTGVVTVNQWVYAIDVRLRTPAIHIHVPGSVLSSGQQETLSVSFDSAPTAASPGTVSLTFQASGSDALLDPAMVFTSTGTASISFTSIPGQTGAAFANQSSATFQTGTTAGTLHISAQWANSTDEIDVALPPSPIVTESIVPTRASDSLDITVTGYDNTRTAGNFTFSFFDAQGAFIGSPVSADFTTLFSKFFLEADYNAGGMFKMVAHFPVTGGTGTIHSVQIDAINQAGDAQSTVVPFN